MNVTGAAVQTLLSPVTLFFLLGGVAGRLKSDLSIPEPISKGIALYLMVAIGFRGGVELSHGGAGSSALTALIVGVALSLALPFVAYLLLRSATRLDVTNAASVAAHYGSVSVVTFAAAVAVLNQQGEPFEPYLVAMLAAMEAPAIISGLFLARRGADGVLAARSPGLPLAGPALRDVMVSGSVVLLLGSFTIGWVTGDRGMEELGPLLDTPFRGVLCLFLLDMGLLAARRLSDLREVGWAVAAFGLYMPLVGAALGIGAAHLLGLSVGGTTLLAVLAASASYIVVPAAMRVALPGASAALSLTLALGITFPFNLMVGIPLYHGVARHLAPARAERVVSADTVALVDAAAAARSPIAVGSLLAMTWSAGGPVWCASTVPHGAVR